MVSECSFFLFFSAAVELYLYIFFGKSLITVDVLGDCYFPGRVADYNPSPGQRLALLDVLMSFSIGPTRDELPCLRVTCFWE